MTKSLQGRNAVVTGASRGIGRAIALALADAGAHVIAIARTQGALEDLDDEIAQLGGSVTLVPACVTDYAATDRLGAAIHERWGQLDILIANAGILGGLRPLGHVEPKVWDEVMAINVTANWRLIRSLDPLLKASNRAQAMFLTSSSAHKCKPFWGPYSVSKAALEALVKTYTAETMDTPVTTSLINPGRLRTRMRAQAMPGEDPKTLDEPDGLAKQIALLCASPDNPSGVIYDFVDGSLNVRTDT